MLRQHHVILVGTVVFGKDLKFYDWLMAWLHEKRGVAKCLCFVTILLETSLLASIPRLLLLEVPTDSHWLVLKVPGHMLANEFFWKIRENEIIHCRIIHSGGNFGFCVCIYIPFIPPSYNDGLPHNSWKTSVQKRRQVMQLVEICPAFISIFLPYV